MLHITLLKTKQSQEHCANLTKHLGRALGFHPWALNHSVLVEMERDRVEACFPGVTPYPLSWVWGWERAKAGSKMLPRCGQLVEDGTILRREPCREARRLQFTS